MKKAYRRALLFISVAFFLGISPYLVFRAMGYRFGLSPGDTAGVGVILLDSNPRRAQITINDTPAGTTPQSVPNLPAGPVTVTVSRDGYSPWQKTLDISATEVVDIRSIRLFPADIIGTPLASNIRHFSLSPSRRLIAAINANNQLIIIDDEDGTQVFGPVVVPPGTADLLWSPDNTSLLISHANGRSLVDLSAEPARATSVPALRRADTVLWDPRVPGRLLYDVAGTLNVLHLPTRATQQIAQDVLSFATSARQIVVLTADSTLERYNLAGQLTNSDAIAATSQPTAIHVTPGGQIAIVFADSSIAHYQDQELHPIADRSITVGWSPDEKLISVQLDDTTMAVFNVADERLTSLPIDQLTTVFRLSRAIRDPQWFAGGRHLIYQLDDEIIISEIDTRDYPVSRTIGTTNLGESNITVGAAGENLLYLKNIDGRLQLTRSPLIIETESFFDFAP